MNDAHPPPGPREERASLRAVAELANVSVATVSRVMSGSSHPVAAATRERVRRAADQLSFQPNRVARALVTARTQTIGIIVHDISDPYFGEIVKGFEDGIRSEGYRLFVASSDRDPTRELEYVRAFDSYQVDAIAFSASGLKELAYQAEMKSLVDRFRSRGGETILLSDHFLTGPQVLFDNRQATIDMVKYLTELGHERIGFIRGPSDLVVTDVRFEGYLSALEQLDLPWEPGLVVDGRFTIESGANAAEMLLATAKPTAVFASNDLMAIGATHRLLANGVRVPTDVSVAGFDDMPLAPFGPVPLTTVRVPTYEVGQRGASLLLGAFRGRTTVSEMLGGDIVIRGSVGPVPD